MKTGTTIDDILTDRLIIRLAKPDDAEEIYSYRSDTIENGSPDISWGELH